MTRARASRICCASGPGLPAAMGAGRADGAARRRRATRPHRHGEHISFAIGAKRIAPLWRLLAGIADNVWRDAIEMDGAQVAVAELCPDSWSADTRLLIRRVALDAGQISADPCSRCRRTLHPDQRALPFPELARRRDDLRLLAHPDEPGRDCPGQGGCGGALPGQYGLDVGSAARRQHGRLAAPAHRPHRRRGHPGRPRRVRRQSHDRHPAAAADRRRPWAADPPRLVPDYTAPARPRPAPPEGEGWPGCGNCPSLPHLRLLSPGSPSLPTARQLRPAERPRKSRTRRTAPGCRHARYRES